jgi:DNA-binding NtrC family response regulator
MPPLRDRLADIPMLVKHFVNAFSSASGQPAPEINADVYGRLAQSAWPGNVRELENAVVRACTLRELPNRLAQSDFVILQGNPEQTVDSVNPNANLAGRSLADLEKLAIQQTLELCGGRKAEAARLLGIAEKSIYNKIKKYEL